MADTTITEVDIWSGVIAPGDGNMPPDHAQAVLQWKFSDDASLRMNELADRNNRGELNDAERQELENYVHVGQVIAILQAKARLSLKRSDANGDS